MIGHIRLCLEEIEAEIDEVGFSVLGARARELLAEHIAGIRCVMDAVEAGPRSDTARADRVAAAPGLEPSLANGASSIPKAA